MCFTNLDFYENIKACSLDGKLEAYVGKFDRKKYFYTQGKSLSHKIERKSILPLNLTPLDHSTPD